MNEKTTWVPELVPLDLIDSNPWQTRLEEDELHVKTLAEDIAENTLLQPGLGRRVNGRVQLAFAHSRLAAFKFLDETFGARGNGQAGDQYARFPVILRELSDRQLSDYAAAENARRKNLTAIEIASAIQKRITDFGLTQIEAGRPFGYTSQGAVANLLRLLKLPELVRNLVNERLLPERLARRLVPFVEIAPDEVGKIADLVAGAPESERDDVFQDKVQDLLDLHGEFMGNMAWPPDWKPGEASLDGEQQTIAACGGCEYRIMAMGDYHCARPACYEVKTRLWATHELTRLSEKLGLPIATWGDERIKPLAIAYNNEAEAKAYLRRKNKPDLYLMADDGSARAALYNPRYHRGLLDCRVVLLGSTNPHLFDKQEAGTATPAGKAATSAGAEESPAARAKRIEAEEREAEERREARSALRRGRHDLVWLIFHTAEMLAVDLPITGGIATYCADLTQRYTNNPAYEWPEYEAAFTPLRTKMVGAMMRIKRDSDDFDKREFILVRRFASGISGYKAEEQFNWTRGCEKVKDVAEDLGLSLPVGWDQPPIHKTAKNCHVCGTFTPGNEITGVDRERGWDDADGAVTCSEECRSKLATQAAPPESKPAKVAPTKVSRRKSQPVKKSQKGKRR